MRRALGSPQAPLVACLAVAFVLRTGWALYAGPVLSPDTHGYFEAARALRADPFTDARIVVNLPPLFPVIIAVAGDVRAVLALQVMLSALIVVPVVRIARGFGTAAAWTAGLLAAASPELLQWVPYLLTDTLGVLLVATTLDLSLTAASRPWLAFAAGLAGGAAFLTRAASVAPTLAGAIAALAGQRRGARLVLFVFAFAAVLAAASVRTFVATGEARPYRDQGSYLLWAGTTWSEQGRATGGIDIILPADHDSWSPDERERFYRSEVARAWQERPFDQVSRMARKVLWFWLPAYPDWSTAHKTVTGGYLVLVYALALVGFVAARRTPTARVIGLALLAMTAQTALTIMDFDGRYRLPAEVLLLPLAGAGAARLRRSLSRPRSSSASPPVSPRSLGRDGSGRRDPPA